MEADELARHAQRSTTHKAQGLSDARWGVGAYSPEDVKRLLTLPVFIGYQRPLQNPATGEFYFVAGASVLGGPDPLG